MVAAARKASWKSAAVFSRLGRERAPEGLEICMSDRECPFLDLEGKTVVIVGGTRGWEHSDRIIVALRLQAAIWIETRDSDPTPRSFDTVIRRRRPALVVGMRGLMRHQHCRDLRRVCKQMGVPLLEFWHCPHPDRLVADLNDRFRGRSI